MTELSLYVPGRSPLHRAPAGAKLLGLLALSVVTIWLTAAWQVGAVLLAVLIGYAVAGIGPGVVVRQVRPLLWFLVVIAAVQVWSSGWQRALAVVSTIVVLVLAAALVTLTTRTTDMADAVVTACRPLRAVGVDPERVGLMIALGMRSVPVVVGIAEQVRDAQRARGARVAPQAYGVALVVRSLRQATALGDALLARGLDD
jgi:biotin transport system permease protein